jgi:hypothetical protein
MVTTSSPTARVVVVFCAARARCWRGRRKRRYTAAKMMMMTMKNSELLPGDLAFVVVVVLEDAARMALSRRWGIVFGAPVRATGGP